MDVGGPIESDAVAVVPPKPKRRASRPLSDLSEPERKTRRAKRSRSRGYRFELARLRDLGSWWCGDRDAFERTRSSGGKARRAKVQHGDVCAVKLAPHDAPFTIECKHVADWTIATLFDAESKVFKFWEQLVGEMRPGTMPLLLISGTRTPVYVMARLETAQVCCPNLSLVPYLHVPQRAAIFMTWAAFVEVANREAIRSIFGRNHAEWSD